MVADAIGRPPAQNRANNEDDALEPGLRENVTRQIASLASHLKNRLVLLGLFGIVAALFGFQYVSAYQDYTLLQDQINEKQAVLNKDDSTAGDIEQGLNTWTAAFAAATQAQSFELDDSSLIERLLAASNDTGTVIQSISTSNNTIIPIENELYDATPFILRVSGNVAQLESFIALLEGDAIGALEVQNSLLAPSDTNGFLGIIRAVVFNRSVDPSELGTEERESLSRRVSDAELDAAASGGKGGTK